MMVTVASGLLSHNRVKQTLRSFVDFGEHEVPGKFQLSRLQNAIDCFH